MVTPVSIEPLHVLQMPNFFFFNHIYLYYIELLIITQAVNKTYFYMFNCDTDQPSILCPDQFIHDINDHYSTFLF